MSILNFEGMGSQLTMQAIRSGIKVNATCTRLTTTVLADVVRVATREISKTPGLPGSPEGGKMSVKKLQLKK
ncbi:hypothetical protein [Arcanobacterium ihumii]|uniref:hypothetical protein n=1 Tax=Arcanobacterium ihumii TaxID=2138162 RepID=UPI000F54A462|nr:hypothetical protein [Arcanobacterium ihumii]